MSLHIQIQSFEGPLDLLLHLIRKEEMNILDINIHHITKQYMDYLKAMKTLDLEVAGEFIAMAATLIYIKSKTLLPKHEHEEDQEDEDPRSSLVQQLLEYERYKKGAEQLYERPLVGRDVFIRGQHLSFETPEDEITLDEDNALFAMISSYRKVIRQMKLAVHKVYADLQSVSSRVSEIRNELNRKVKTLFRDLILIESSGKDRRNQVLLTFLSLLELTKMGFVSLFQTENFSDIHIEKKKDLEGDLLFQMDEYESIRSAFAEDLTEQL